MEASRGSLPSLGNSRKKCNENGLGIHLEGGMNCVIEIPKDMFVEVKS
jgi:hypothetical protein